MKLVFDRAVVRINNHNALASSNGWLFGSSAALFCFACAVGLLVAKERWLLVVGIFACLLLVLRPLHVTLGLYTFLIPFESMTTLGSGDAPTATLLRYVGISAILILLGWGWLHGPPNKLPRTALYWSLFVVWASISSVWAIRFDSAFQRVSTAVGLCLLYLAFVLVRLTPSEVSWLSLTTMLGGCSASLYSEYMFVRTGGAIARASMTEGGGQADPNFFAFTLLLPLALACGEVLAGGSLFRRLWFITVAVLICVAVLLTMSRGALAAAAAMSITFVLRSRLNRRIVVPLVLAGASLFFMPRLFFERIQEASTTRLAGRQDIWQVGIRSLESYWAIGAGLDNFQYAFQKYEGTSRFFAGDQRDAHNIYLASAVELGAVGVLLFAGAVRLHLKALHRIQMGRPPLPRLIACEAACWGLLVTGLTLNILWRKEFWFIWAFSLAVLSANSEDRNGLACNV